MKLFIDHFNNSADYVKTWIVSNNIVIHEACNLILKTIQSGKKIFVCGNGGSAAEAQHLTAELVNGMTLKHGKAFPVICINSDVSTITAIGNDRGFEFVFSRQIEALGSIGDLLIMLSTSGESLNIVEASNVARSIKMKTIGLFGLSYNPSAKADILISFPGCRPPQIQELHLMIIHAICEHIEEVSLRPKRAIKEDRRIPGHDAMARAEYQRMIHGMSGI